MNELKGDNLIESIHSCLNCGEFENFGLKSFLVITEPFEDLHLIKKSFFKLKPNEWIKRR